MILNVIVGFFVLGMILLIFRISQLNGIVTTVGSRLDQCCTFPDVEVMLRSHEEYSDTSHMSEAIEE